jgi:hypothetical protein
MVFGSFNEEIEPLADYLGDMRFYLDAFFERFPGGIEFLGAPHRRVIHANWKLPVEKRLPTATFCLASSLLASRYNRSSFSTAISI